eukprot:TRINITY_DN5693_c0_g1_i1.p1 TRINITY_DN5693_c0_g1~~TRINITY_DN5693_c0_g1_i1.p1  ORF type:complete len:208 (+),score=35.96 TRINITY_DN5693_c0_g1_i1:48-626(+)
MLSRYSLGLLFLVSYARHIAGCCSEIKLESTGFAGSKQGERLGVYGLIGTNNGGNLYRQVNGNNYMYFLPNDGFWMVGPDPGVNHGGILNYEKGACPEDLTQDWWYWDDFFEEWDTDWSMEAKCTGSPGPDNSSTKSPDPVDPEPCTWGDVCYSCDIWAEVNGVRYCCANDCNHGGIETSSENGQVMCYCYH